MVTTSVWLATLRQLATSLLYCPGNKFTVSFNNIHPPLFPVPYYTKFTWFARAAAVGDKLRVQDGVVCAELYSGVFIFVFYCCHAWPIVYVASSCLFLFSFVPVLRVLFVSLLFVLFIDSHLLVSLRVIRSSHYHVFLFSLSLSMFFICSFFCRPLWASVLVARCLIISDLAEARLPAWCETTAVSGPVLRRDRALVTSALT